MAATSPVISLILIQSPTLKALLYCTIKPAMVFDIADCDPNEKRIPINIEIPLNASVSEPGI
jgi:hypothetical protein